jgi:GNAT superfamily N-acetyltransferase
MNVQKSQIIQDKVIITRLTRKFASDLIPLFKLNSEDASVLYQGLIYDILRSVRLLPHATKLVAYHVEEKTAIGFITLEENTKTLFSIKDVFVDPRYRKMGIASGLLDYAITLAKEKGAKKLNLNVDPTKTNVIELYKKLGFREIGHTLLVQGPLSGFSRLKVIKRAFLGQRRSRTDELGKKRLFFETRMNSKRNRESFFDIYQRCMTKDWLDFFEINSNNVVYGSRHVWQPPFFKDALISDSKDSFVLVFNQQYPPRPCIILELYRNLDVAILPVLEDLLVTLSDRGTGFTQLWLFGNTDDIPSEWFEEKKMMAFNFLCMGKIF